MTEPETPRVASPTPHNEYDTEPARTLQRYLLGVMLGVPLFLALQEKAWERFSMHYSSFAVLQLFVFGVGVQLTQLLFRKYLPVVQRLLATDSETVQTENSPEMGWMGPTNRFLLNLMADVGTILSFGLGIFVLAKLLLNTGGYGGPWGDSLFWIEHQPGRGGNPTPVSFIYLGLVPLLALNLGYVIVQGSRRKLSWHVVVPFVVNMVSHCLFCLNQTQPQNLPLGLIMILLTWTSLVWGLVLLWSYARGFVVRLLMILNFPHLAFVCLITLKLWGDTFMNLNR